MSDRQTRLIRSVTETATYRTTKMEEEDEERRRQRKLEEALEVKSLRRIISAYLKYYYLRFPFFFLFFELSTDYLFSDCSYPEASEEDVRRYEASYRKLSPAHKVCEYGIHCCY